MARMGGMATDGASSNNDLLKQALTVSGTLAIVFLALWAVAVATAPPEPKRFLEIVREEAPEAAPRGMPFSLHECSHCPAFIMFDRGFGSSIDPSWVMLLTLWSLPAVRFARLWATRPWIPDLNPLAFGAGIVIQWIILGVLLRLALHVLFVLRNRPHVSALRGR